MSTPTKIGVMVATPVKHFGGIDALHPFFKAQLNRLAELTADPECPYEFQLAFIEGGMVRGRNKMVAEFRRQRKTTPSLKFLHFWDDDIEGTAENLLTLLLHRRPLVGGLYCRRQPKGIWVANFMMNVELQPGNLLQTLELGTGFKLHHFQVFDELERIFPELSYVDRDSGERLVGFFQNAVLHTDLRPDGDLLSEDFFFDHLCRHARIGIFADTSMKLKHRGPDGSLYPTEWPAIPGVEVDFEEGD